MADDTHSRGYRNDPYRREGAGPSGQSADPLTELARLIGQSDPFATGTPRERRTDARASEPAAPQDWQANQSSNPPQYHDQHDPDPHAPQADEYNSAPDARYADDAYEAHDRYPPAAGGHAAGGHYDQGYADSPAYRDQPGHDDQAYAGAPHAQPGALGYDDSYRGHDTGRGEGYEAPYLRANEHGPAQEDEFYEDEPEPRRRGGLITVAALVGLAVIGGAGAFAYRTVFTGAAGTPPVIRSDAGPNKIVPAAQNADNATNKQIYDRMGDRGQNERVVSREEQPLSIPDPARAGSPSISAPASPSPGAPIAGLPGSAPAAQPPFPGTSAAAPPPGPGEPRKIRTVTIKADQPANEAARPATPSRVAAPPAPRAGAPAAPASPNAPLALVPQEVASAAPPPPAPRAHAVAPPPRAPAANAAVSGGYFVQLSAQKSEDDARSSFRNIQAKYASVLSGRELVIRRKDLGSKGVFYGAQVGPLSHEAAVQLCESLKSAGGSCMLQRN